ncbi:Alpha/Beta hydrolase protein [Ochromonadaceae sp. CCMP2298]|nr:Alpha/Beta hydrolase protein [Ochromonadaceae sp. CCMP2298]
MKFLIPALTIGAVAARGVLKDGPVQEQLCDKTVKSLSGYFSVGEEQFDKNYFYWMFESRSSPSTDPLVMWLTGGPGCSSQLALLSENGPCKVTEDGLGTVNNPYSWNNNANIFWIDQPADVGYSYGTPNDNNEEEVGNDMFDFLQNFFTAHPEYVDRPLFVFGESYGGHYAPAIAARIFQGNLDNEGIHINLAGVGVGNGLTDPVVQYQYYPEMAMNNSYDIKTVSEDAYDKMVSHVPACVKMAQACQLDQEACVPADDFCNLMETTPYYKTGLNPYDIRVPCGESDLCYDFTNIETYLNLNSTREALGVSSKVESWQTCNNAVNALFAGDWMHNFQQVLQPLLEGGVRVLIYAGDVDFICNWIGNKAWTKELPWTGKAAYNAEADTEWVYVDEVAGSVQQVVGGKARTAMAAEGAGSLTFLQVYEAGHMVPMDQPAAALALLNAFTANKDFY